MPHYHPKRRANGDKVTIHQPSRPSEAANWVHADAIVTIVPGGETPIMLNGIALQPVTQPRRSLDWSALAETSRFAEPEFAPPQGLKSAAAPW